MGKSCEKICMYLCCCMVIAGMLVGLIAIISKCFSSFWTLCGSAFIIFMTILVVYYKLKYKIEDATEESCITKKYLDTVRTHKCRLQCKRAVLYVVAIFLFLVINGIVLILYICSDVDSPSMLSMTHLSSTPFHENVYSFLAVNDSIYLFIIFVITSILLFIVIYCIYKISHKIQIINSTIIKIETYTATSVSKDIERKIQLEINRLTQELNADSSRDIWRAIFNSH